MYHEEWIQYWRSRAWYSEDRLMRIMTQKRKKRSNRLRTILVKSKQDNNKGLEVSKILESINTFDDVVKHKADIKTMALKSEKIKALLNILPACEKMAKLVGLEDTKKQLFQVLLMGMSKNVTLEHRNIVLLGGPGLGKTTLLNIFGEAYKQAGLATKENVVFASRADLVGQYLGSSAIKTQEVVKRAMNGILVIDEAYSLGSKENRDFFSKEVVDTLTGLMDVHKHELLVVVAGYEKEVRECFFGQNVGLERRFLTWIRMESYTKKQLLQIFIEKCKPFFIFENEKEIQNIFLNLCGQLKNQAGDCTSIVTKMNMMLAKKRWINDGVLTISAIDVKDAIDLVAKGRGEEHDNSTMLSMYT